MRGGKCAREGENIHMKTLVKKSIHFFSLKKNITNIVKNIYINK